MIFAKNSTRTRVSFESGMFQMGGHAIYLNARESQDRAGGAGGGHRPHPEPLLRLRMIRTYAQEEAEVYNMPTSRSSTASTDFAHPCQVLADLMTIREKNAYLEGVNSASSGTATTWPTPLIVAASAAGLSVSVATPPGALPHPEVLAFAEAYGDKFRLCHDPKQAIAGAEVVVTDAWTSMGRERGEEERRALFAYHPDPGADGP